MDEVLCFSYRHDNSEDANSNNIHFTIKDNKLYVPVVTFSAKDNQKLSKILCKGFKRSVYCNEYKTSKKSYIFSNQTLLELSDCLFWNIQIKMTMLRDLKLKDVTY